MPRPTRNIAGQRFGRLVADSRVCSGGQARWLCRCDCGNSTLTWASNLLDGQTGSCGCLSREACIARSTTHGATGTRLYGVWADMRKRCFNPRATRYADYGGRGITVCQRWAESFEAFAADMGPCPEGMELDRWPDKNGNYEPGNCRWATLVEQARNKRNNVLVAFEGRQITVAEYAERTGIKYATAYYRAVVSRNPEYIRSLQTLAKVGLEMPAAPKLDWEDAR